jgi:hypothetical protein
VLRHGGSPLLAPRLPRVRRRYSGSPPLTSFSSDTVLVSFRDHRDEVDGGGDSPFPLAASPEERAARCRRRALSSNFDGP